ncbi:MAG: RNA ligase family protein [Candidatus Obscuribacterales bacterium]|nr:RNA ligase family protein [Candidatus Obscuribacterales bacterium]
MELLKYPRTRHIQGSSLQKGDEDLSAVDFSRIAGRNIVVEEKFDGANSAISYAQDRSQLLQSRGHYLQGGLREKHFDLMKQWAAVHSKSLFEVLGTRYICFGEWMFAKHTIFYDQLPHYWLEFDIFDRHKSVFLSTSERLKLLKLLPVSSVRVLFEGKLNSYKELTALVGRSGYISDEHLDKLKKQASSLGLAEEQILKETEKTYLMEGLYIKVEEDGIVKERYKYVRSGFLNAVFDSESHWLNRPILPNILREGVNIYDSSS